MHKIFCYWVPTTENIDFESLKKSKSGNSIQKSVTISDMDEKVDILLNMNTSSFDIIVTILFEKNKLDTINLTCQKYQSNGIITYKAESVSNEKTVQSLTTETETVLKIQAYHLFKEFFHKHEYHSKKHDSLLEAYVSTGSIDDDQILMHYAELYVKKFHAYRKKLNLISTTKIIDRFVNKKELDTLLTPAIQAITTAKSFIHQAMGEMIYAEYIIESIKNQETSLNYQNKLNKFRQQFEVQHKKYDLTYEQIDMLYSKNINSLQIYLGMIGVVLGILGILFAII